MTDTPNTAPTPEMNAVYFVQEIASEGAIRRIYQKGCEIELQRNAALADNAKLQAALDEAQAACAAKDDAIMAKFPNGLRIGEFLAQQFPATDGYIPLKDWLQCLSNSVSSTCSQPILARLAAAEEDTKRLASIELFHFWVMRVGYRGRDGWEVRVSDPGGHYQEERTRTEGYGNTAREAIDDALKRPVYVGLLDAARSANGGAQ